MEFYRLLQSLEESKFHFSSTVNTLYLKENLREQSKISKGNRYSI